MLQEMSDSTTPKRGRGRPKAANPPPPKEKSMISLPAGMKERIKRAMAAQTMLGADPPDDVSSWVAGAIDREIARIEEAYQASIRKK